MWRSVAVGSLLLAALSLLPSGGVTTVTSLTNATSGGTSKPTPSSTPSTPAAPATPAAPRGPLPGSVTCLDVEQAGSVAALPAASLRALLPQQAASCIALLGKDPLGPDQARAVWDLLLQAFDSADLVPDDTLRLLGWVSAGIPPDHMANLTLSEIDTVSTLGNFHNLSLTQWSAKEPEDLSHLDLAALNHILCGFNATDIARVHADAYKEAASALSLLRCPGTPGAADLPAEEATLPPLRALAALAALAESGDAFGDPGRWGAATVGAVGCVLVGLSNSSVSRIPSASLHGMLTALAARERPIIQRCLYGTPLIAQKLSSSEETRTSSTSSTSSPSSTPSSTTSTASTTSRNETLGQERGQRSGSGGQAVPDFFFSVSVASVAAVGTIVCYGRVQHNT